MQTEKYEEALRDYNKLNELEPDNPEHKNNMKTAKTEAKRAKKKDYYKILEIPRIASESDIKKAYRKLALEWHPDKWATESEEKRYAAEQKFKEITEAYSILTDPKKKQRVDMGEDLNESELGFDGVDVNQIFQQMFAGGNSPFGTSFGDGGFGGPFGNSSGFSFGGGRRGRTHFNFG